MADTSRNQHTGSDHEQRQDTTATGAGNDARSGRASVNPAAGGTGDARTDYRDPHGNQSGREPEGGNGAGQSRGDGSSFNPGSSSTDAGETRRRGQDSYPVEGSEASGAPGSADEGLPER